MESGEISFRANLGGTDWLANAGLYVQIPAMSTTAFNVGSAFDTSNFRFTPGVAGRYLLTGALSMVANNILCASCPEEQHLILRIRLDRVRRLHIPVE